MTGPCERTEGLAALAQVLSSADHTVCTRGLRGGGPHIVALVLQRETVLHEYEAGSWGLRDTRARRHLEAGTIRSEPGRRLQQLVRSRDSRQDQVCWWIFKWHCGSKTTP